MPENTVQIVINAKDQASQVFRQVEKSTATFAQRTKKNLDMIKTSINQLSSTARWGFLGLSGAIAGATYAYVKQEKMEQKLRAALQANLKVVNKSIEPWKKFAAQLQRVTTYGDEANLEAMALLNTFQLTEKQIQKLMPRVQNLAAMYDMDLRQAALQVGRALTYGASALSRYGIVMTDAEKQAWELTTQQERVNLLLKILDKNTGPAAKALRNTLGGAILALKNEFGDLMEQIGEMFKPWLMKQINTLIDLFREWKESIAALTPEQRRAIVQMTLMGGAVLALIGSLSLFGKVAGLVVASGSLMAGVFGLLLNPVALLAVGVAALAALWILKWDDIKKWTQDTFKAIAEKLDWEGFKNKVAAVWEKTKGLIDVIGKVSIAGYEWAKDKIADIGAWLKEHIWDIFNKTLYLIGFVGGIAFQGYKWLEDKIAPLGRWIKENALKIWDRTQELTGFIGGVFISGYKWIESKMINFAGWLKENLPAFISKMVEIGGVVGGVFIRAYQWIKEKMVSLIEWLPKNLPELKEKFIELGGIVGGLFIKAFVWIKEKMLDLAKWLPKNLPELKEKFIEIGGIIGGVFIRGYQWLKEKMLSFASWVVHNIPDILTKVVEVGGIIGGVFISGYKWIKEKILSFASWVKDNLPKFAEKVVEIGSVIGGVFISGYRWLKEKMLSFMSWVSDHAKDILPKIVEIGSIVGQVFISGWEFVKEKIVNIKDFLKNWWETSGKKDLEGFSLKIDKLMAQVGNFIINLPQPPAWSLKVGKEVFKWSAAAMVIGRILRSLMLTRVTKRFGKLTIKVGVTIAFTIGAAVLVTDAINAILKAYKPEEVKKAIDKFQKEHPILTKVFLKFQPFIDLLPLVSIVNLKLEELGKYKWALPLAIGITPFLPADAKKKIDEFLANIYREIVNALDKLKKAGLDLWQILISFFTGGPGAALKKIQDVITKIKEPIQEGFKVGISWQLFPKADEQTRDVIENIDKVKQKVAELGIKPAEGIEKLTIALMASESSFDKNAEATDRLGRKYQGLGQLGQEALEVVRKLGYTVTNVNDPLQNTTATMIYLNYLLKENKNNVTEALLKYKGWGDELRSVGGDFSKFFEKFPDAKKQLQIVLRYLAKFGFDAKELAARIGEETGHAFYYGASPGGIIPTMIEGQKEANKVMERNLSGMIKDLSNLSIQAKKLLEPIFGFLKIVIEKLIAAIRKVSPETADALQGLINAVDKFFNDWKVLTETPSPLSSISEGLKNATEKARPLSDAMLSLRRTISYTVDQGTIWQRIWSKVLTSVSQSWQYIFNLISEGWDKIMGGMDRVTSAWSSTINKWIEGGMKFSDFLVNMFNDIRNTFLSLVSEMAAKWLFNMTFGGMAPGAAWAAAIGLAGGAVLPGGFEPIKGFQEGAIVKRPTLGIIGEGPYPEAVLPLKGGKIPVDVRSPSVTVTQHVHISAIDAKSVAEFVREHSDIFAAPVYDAIKKNSPLRGAIRQYAR